MTTSGKPAGLLMTLAFAIIAGNVSCAERQATEDRVPSSKIEQARAFKAPYGDSRQAPAEVIAAGKGLYEGKGACATCHGVHGKGDGPAAHMITPHPPRNFTDCRFHAEREDGELFWVIKYGSPGTGMQALVPATLTEDEAWKIVAYERSFCRE